MERLLIGALAAGAAIWGYGLWNLVDNARSAKTLKARPWDGAPAPSISVVLPARNEAHQIRACVESLRSQDYPNWRLVVDDRSEDGTGAILAEIAAEEPRMTVLSGTELPPGWMGKSWANHQGVAATQDEWLLFTDADTWHHPSALSSFMRYTLDEATMRFRQGDLDGAMELLESVRPAFDATVDGILRIIYFGHLASGYLRQGKWDKAWENAAIAYG